MRKRTCVPTWRQARTHPRAHKGASRTAEHANKAACTNKHIRTHVCPQTHTHTPVQRCPAARRLCSAGTMESHHHKITQPHYRTSTLSQCHTIAPSHHHAIAISHGHAFLMPHAPSPNHTAIPTHPTSGNVILPSSRAAAAFSSMPVLWTDCLHCCFHRAATTGGT